MDTCTKRPYPKNDITPAQQFDMLKELGYAGIGWTEEAPRGGECGRQGGRGTRAEDVHDLLRRHRERGRRAQTVGPDRGHHGGAPRARHHHLAAYRGERAGHRVALGRLPGRRHLRDLAGKAERNGLCIAIYPHIGDWTEHFEDAVRIARLVDRKNFGVTFNLCHTLAVGDEPRIPALLEQAGASLLAVTINGADSGVKGPQWNRLIQPLDRGSFDLGVVLRTLRKIGYHGPIGLQGYGLEGDRRKTWPARCPVGAGNPPRLPPGPCRDAFLPGARERGLGPSGGASRHEPAAQQKLHA